MARPWSAVTTPAFGDWATAESGHSGTKRTARPQRIRRASMADSSRAVAIRLARPRPPPRWRRASAVPGSVWSQVVVGTVLPNFPPGPPLGESVPDEDPGVHEMTAGSSLPGLPSDDR